MNYKNACINPSNTIKSIKAKPLANKQTDAKEKEKAKFNRSCAKAMEILYLRWTKYKEDYIALHGEDEYERMYLTPNYWVMPEDDEAEDELSSSEKEDDFEYYSS